MDLTLDYLTLNFDGSESFFSSRWRRPRGVTFVFTSHGIDFSNIVNTIAGLFHYPVAFLCGVCTFFSAGGFSLGGSASSHIRLTANKLSLGVTPPSPQDCWDKLQPRLYCECKVRDDWKGMDGWNRLNWNIIFHWINGKKKNIRENPLNVFHTTLDDF